MLPGKLGPAAAEAFQNSLKEDLRMQRLKYERLKYELSMEWMEKKEEAAPAPAVAPAAAPAQSPGTYSACFLFLVSVLLRRLSVYCDSLSLSNIRLFCGHLSQRILVAALSHTTCTLE